MMNYTDFTPQKHLNLVVIANTTEIVKMSVALEELLSLTKCKTSFFFTT